MICQARGIHGDGQPSNSQRHLRTVVRIMSRKYAMVHISRNDADLWNIFPTCICNTSLPQIGGLLWKSTGFVCTQAYEMHCIFTYRFRSLELILLWRSNVVMEMVLRRKWFCKWVSFQGKRGLNTISENTGVRVPLKSLCSTVQGLWKQEGYEGCSLT